MNTGLDQQLGDLAWSIATGLRAAYDLHQVFQAMAAEAPEPAASACKRLLAELDKGLELTPALVNWQNAIPSVALSRLVEALKQPSEDDFALPDILEALSDDLLREFGSDPAFYPSMRREADQLGAKAPERALRV